MKQENENEIADKNSSLVAQTGNKDATQTVVVNLPANGFQSESIAKAIVPWIADVLRSDESLKAYGADLVQFAEYLDRQGLDALSATADHVKLYKAHLLKSGRPASVARKLSVIRGAYQQLANKRLVDWEEAQRIQAIKAPPVAKNTTPALTEKQANDLLRAIPTDTLRGVRDLAMLLTLFLTGCRVSAICRGCVGHLEFDGEEHYLHVREKRNKESRKLLLHAAPALYAYMEAAGITHDREGPLFRPLSPNKKTFARRHLGRKTPWQLVKKYCYLAGIDPDRLQGRGIGVHSLRKTAITNAIRNGARMHEVREFAGHSDIRTTELYFVRREEDAEMAARKIRISLK